MSKINILLTLLSLNAVLVIIERLSPTTKIILQPYSYLRVHEVFQMTIVIAFSFIISFLILKVVTNSFQNLKSLSGTVLGVIFIMGLYFTATGNGLHEVASFLYNTFCNTKKIGQGFCAASFFDDYYFGNIVYFVGLFLGNVSIILLEKRKVLKQTSLTQSLITIGNGVIYALALFVYAAYDVVSVGAWFVTVSSAAVLLLIFYDRKKITLTPFALYSLVSYGVATVLTLAVRH